VNVGAFFVLLTLVYLALFVYLLTRQRSATAAIISSVHEGAGALLSSPFLLAIVSIAFLIFTSTVIDSIAPPSGPSVTLLGLTVAPLVEEFGFRVLLIGVFTALLSLRLHWKGILGVLWRPSSAYSGDSAGSPVRTVVIALLLISSLVFGAAHVANGEWTLNKLYDATYGGLVLGYLYIRYGFAFAVIAHWGIDYFGSVFTFFGHTAYGIPLNGPVEYVLQRAVDYDTFQLLGLASFLLVVYLGLKRLQRRSASSEVHKDVQERSMFGI
jgi:membrane protease YdiL (CAAX protease family)